MATKSKFFRFRHFLIKDGSQIMLWEDKWLDNAPLREQYPSLYNIVLCTIAKVMSTSPLVVTSRRDLIRQRLVAWNSLLQCLAAIQLSPGSDEFRWNLYKNGEFSMDSMYKALIQLDIPVDSKKMIWKMKIPLKLTFSGGIFVDG
jgi:hypothetical protein